MQKRSKVKLRGAERSPLYPMDLQVALGLTTECMAAVTDKLVELSTYIQSVNPNIHPIKFTTKQQWQNTIDDTIGLINGRLQEVLNLEHLPDAIREGLQHRPKAV